MNKSIGWEILSDHRGTVAKYFDGWTTWQARGDYDIEAIESLKKELESNNIDYEDYRGM